MVTVPLAVSVLVWPAYRTLMVQLLPGATGTPEAQVPPVIVKVPLPVPLVWAIDGAVLSVNGPGAVAAFVPVIVPFFVPGPPPLSAGVGPLKVTVVPVTVNVRGVLVCPPPVMARVTVLAPSNAEGETLKVAVADVSFAFFT